MGRYSDIDGESVERLLAGSAPGDGTDLADVARFLDRLSEAYPEAPTEEFEAAHVVAMMEASTGLSPDRRVVGMFDKAIMLVRTALKPAWAKVAAATTALVLAFSGVAIAGVLPTPVQDAVAHAVAGVGIDLPDSEDVDEAPDSQEATEATETDVDQAGDADEATEAIDADEVAEPDDDADETAESAETAEPDDDADEIAEPAETAEPDEDADVAPEAVEPPETD